MHDVGDGVVTATVLNAFGNILGTTQNPHFERPSNHEDHKTQMETPPPLREEQSLGDWLMEPQTMIALSAVLISVCGLFVSLYETSLMRTEQRAAVWPRLSIGVTVNDSVVTFTAQNAGVGPARVESAALRYNDSTVVNWTNLLQRTSRYSLSVQQNLSLLNGRVVSPETQVDIATFTFRDLRNAQALAASTLDGSVNVRACYCSVYDDCWMTELQDHLPSARQIGLGLSQDTLDTGRAASDASPQMTRIQKPRPVPSCDNMDRSSI